MRKLFTLTFALVFMAASCNLLNLGGSGSMGVFRSDDSADSFHEKNTINKKTNLQNISVNSLVMDPNNSQTLYLAASAGMVETTDSGETWKSILSNFAVGDIAVDPSNSSTIYGAGADNGHGKIVKTTDSAGSWKDIYSEPSNGNSVLALAIDPRDHNHLLAGLSAGEIIQSLDAGVTWQVMADLHDPVAKLRYGPNAHAYVLTQTHGLYEQKDPKSNTFTILTDTLNSGFVNFNSNFSAVSKYLDLAFDAKQSGVLYLATDAGLVRTINDGTGWNFMSMPVRNSELRTASVAVNPKDSNNIYAVVGTTMFKSINGGVTWQTKQLPTGWEVREILIDQTSPNVIYLGLGTKK